MSQVSERLRKYLDENEVELAVTVTNGGRESGSGRDSVLPGFPG